MSAEAVKLLKSLVAIPSVNPDQAGRREDMFEARMAAHIGEILSNRGFKVRFLSELKDRPNVIATFGPSNPRRILALEGHLDTVSVEGMTLSPFSPEIREGRLYGRGACDTKGPTAAALAALTPERLQRLADRGIQVVFLGAMGEECGNLGAQELVDDGFQCDDCLVLEPTGNRPVVAHKGALWARCQLAGQPGHGSDPDAGCNAILAAGELIRRIFADHARRSAEHEDPLLGRETLNVGRIQGGSAVNIIAGECATEFDCRYLPEQDGEAILHSWHEQLQSCLEEGLAMDGHVEIIKHALPFESDTHSSLVRDLVHSVQEVEGESGLSGSAWYSDAGVLNAAASNTVVFGPGSILQAHTRDEFIALDALETGTHIFGRFLDRYGEDEA